MILACPFLSAFQGAKRGTAAAPRARATISNRSLRVAIMSSALHFGTHNGAESYRGIVWHTDHHRRKILDIMSGFVGAPRRCPPEAVSGPDGFMDFPGSDPRSGALGDARLVRRSVRSDRVRRCACPFQHGEDGAASARPARQPQERIAASEAVSPGRCVLGRKEGASILEDRRRWNAEGARNSDEMVMSGQLCSAVEFHPLPG